MRIARRRLPNGYEAEDCVHEAMLRCVTFARLDDRRVGEFLTSTVMRLCVDYRRRAVRMHQLKSQLDDGGSAPHPEELACDLSAGRHLLQAASALRGRERQILLARADGFSTAQAASLFGISLKAAEGAFTRGRARLRALCAEAM